jgi:hypothetical protein
VLVDYSFDVGGSYASRQLDQNINLSWDPVRYVNVYFRYFNSAPQVTSGSPTSPLNTVHSTLVGSRVEWPLTFPYDLTVGGYFEREDRRETIAPYVRTADEVFLRGEAPAFIGADFRIGARRTRIDSSNPEQASDLKGVDLAFGWWHPWGVRIFATGSFERDTGSPEFRERRVGALRASWQFRRITLSANLSRAREVQGELERDHTAGQLTMRRDFR